VTRRDARGRLLAAAAALLASGASAEPLPEDAGARQSYSLGHQIGVDLVRQGRSVDLESLRRGLRDGLAGQPPALPEAEMQALLRELKRGIAASEREQRLAGASLRRAGAEFLAANAGRPGVVSLPSGVQYRVIRAGRGRSPGPGDRVRVRYRSERLDGTAFHDSLREGAPAETLRVDAVIPGLGEALQLMAEGARFEIAIPPQLAFGRRGPLADHTVVYEVELVEVVSPAAGTAEATP
jgi:FKBP-type peptidyl-prolyl cis-trans isomerase FklB